MTDLEAVLAGLDPQYVSPNDATPRMIVADLLDETRWGWGEALRAACDLHRQVPGLTLPDRYSTFHTPSKGWERVGKQLEEMAAHPEDSAAFRARYERLVRGDVPLAPEHLEATLHLQYDLQVRLLDSLNLLEYEDEEQFLTAMDGKRYPLPAFEDILARLQIPEMQTKLTQGFTELLIVPIGLSFQRFLEAWREGLRRNAATLRTIGAFDEEDPLRVLEQFSTEPLVYGPHSFTNNHGGRTKEELRRGFDVLLVEGNISNLPRAGQEQTIGGRTQIPCGRSPGVYLRDLQARDDSGLTPEAYILQFLDALERKGQVLDTETFTLLTDAYLPTSRGVPNACWFPELGQADLSGGDSGYHGADYGVRAAVRVS